MRQGSCINVWYKFHHHCLLGLILCVSHSDQVVHPAPGNARGTLVNAILNHCSLPTIALSDVGWSSEVDDVSEHDLNIDVHPADKLSCEETSSCSIRPGIVHRLDKGTSGLLVVAKVRLFYFLWDVLFILRLKLCRRIR